MATERQPVHGRDHHLHGRLRRGAGAVRRRANVHHRLDRRRPHRHLVLGHLAGGLPARRVNPAGMEEETYGTSDPQAHRPLHRVRRRQVRTGGGRRARRRTGAIRDGRPGPRALRVRGRRIAAVRPGQRRGGRDPAGRGHRARDRPDLRAAQRRYQRVRGPLRPAAQSVVEDRLAGHRAADRPQAREGRRRQRRLTLPQYGTPAGDFTAASVADAVPGRGAGSGEPLPAAGRGGSGRPIHLWPGRPCATPGSAIM